MGLATMNAFVHVVMYAYYLASALKFTPPLSWKRQITRLQICQFTCGVVGGSYYWLMYVREPRLAPFGTWPPLTYTEGCAGGEPMTVLVGFVTNAALLTLFAGFYRRAYRAKPKGGAKGSAKPKADREPAPPRAARSRSPGPSRAGRGRGGKKRE